MPVSGIGAMRPRATIFAVTRVPIPDDVAADVLFASHRICCVCTEPGKPVQLHHIDEDHANNARENLAVLCLDCHYQTQIRGGFARHLDPAQVRQYRDDWVARMQRRRDESDRIAVEVMTRAAPRQEENRGTLNVQLDAIGVAQGTSTASAVGVALGGSTVPLLDYVRTLPALRRQAYANARPEWDSGVTARMVEATYQVIDVLQEALVRRRREE